MLEVVRCISCRTIKAADNPTLSYSGWGLAANPDNLTQQLYQPMFSLNSWNDSASKLRGAGVWGVGGVAAANDGSVFALTGNAGNPPSSYWGGHTGGSGSVGDFFQGRCAAWS